MDKNGPIQELISVLSKIQGFGARGATRATISLISHREDKLLPLIEALAKVAADITKCPVCGNFDTCSPCSICRDASRDSRILCVVADITSLWAFERGGFFKGRYHVIGGVLSAISGVEPKDLNLSGLAERIAGEGIEEVVLALPATIDAKITAHYIAQLVQDTGVKITELAHGVPIGGELDYLDSGTIEEALRGRKNI
ncbi:MAG: recombination mediator RecR [Rickettsiales bacterium]|jgi:recombination protein RecR|nr:recombination mediator RecR [Rickettsiales bacterium]